MMDSRPAFIQGVFAFQGAGYDAPASLPGAAYRVPPDRRSQAIYFRAGNSAPAMVAVVMMRGGVPMRYFPLGATGAVHVPLAVTEDLPPETVIELMIAAPAGATGSVVVDFGFLEI